MVIITNKAEWIAATVRSLDQAAAMLMLDANEWRDRAHSRNVPRSRVNMHAIAAANDGMAWQLIALCKFMTDLLASEATTNPEGE